MGKYYNHVTPNGGIGVEIAQAIWQQLSSDNINMEKLLFLGCDGTNVNTGHEHGTHLFFIAFYGYGCAIP